MLNNKSQVIYVDHFVNESINSLEQEVIEVRLNILYGL